MLMVPTAATANPSPVTVAVLSSLLSPTLPAWPTPPIAWRANYSRWSCMLPPVEWLSVRAEYVAEPPFELPAHAEGPSAHHCFNGRESNGSGHRHHDEPAIGRGLYQPTQRRECLGQSLQRLSSDGRLAKRLDTKVRASPLDLEQPLGIDLQQVTSRAALDQSRTTRQFEQPWTDSPGRKGFEHRLAGTGQARLERHVAVAGVGWVPNAHASMLADAS
jgi:hypothetical protein